MARIRNGILGGFSNKVGEVIGQNYAGVSTMRAMPKYVTNPKTPAQEAHRAKVALLGEFLRPLALVTNLSTWGGNSVYNSYNKAFRANFANVVIRGNSAFIDDYRNLNLGSYNGYPFKDMLATFTYSNDLLFCTASLTWDTEKYEPFCFDTDRPIFFVLHELTGGNYEIVFADLLECQRSWGEYVFTFPLPPKTSEGTTFYYCFGYTYYSIPAISEPKTKSSLRDIDWDLKYNYLKARYLRQAVTERAKHPINKPGFDNLIFIPSPN